MMNDELRITKILLPLPFDKAFDYLVPPHLVVGAGDYVRVPFGSREVYGVVWGVGGESVNPAKLKIVAAKAEHLPPMPAAMRDWIDWVAWYTLAPKGAVLKMALTSPDALQTPATEAHYTLAEGAAPNSKAREKIAALLEDGFARNAKDIAAEVGVSASTVQAWARAGGLTVHLLTLRPDLPSYHIAHKPTLSEAQQHAAAALTAALGQGFTVSVIDGVTGSGKTEVYFEVMENLLFTPSISVTPPKGESNLAQQDLVGVTQGQRQILILLPEIALSVQWLERFTARFGGAPLLWHSSVSTAQKRETWRAVASGKASVVVGARSALFLPFQNLRLIILDEEHEGSYKQEDGVIYHARDMAIARAQKQGIPVMLASATPSLETLLNIQQGKYRQVDLPARHGGAEMPEVEMIDMRAHKPGAERWISEPLRAALEESFDAGQQAMLFLNRRGYAPLTLCRSCGYRFGCPHCSSWLVMHSWGTGKEPHTPHPTPHTSLRCHHCDFRTPLPNHCPECGSKDENTLVACGPGVERVAVEAARLFPDIVQAQMTSDALQTPQQISALMQRIQNGEVQLIIGTQMMAKGHHFPHLATVGVVDADMGLAGGDLRASERCWQLLHQLAGRAGRTAGVKGRVLLQSYLPDHAVMKALAGHDRDGFFALEMQQRQAASMPPYGKLAALILEGKDEGQVRAAGQHIAQQAPQNSGLRCIGPAPAPLAMLRGKYRYRLLIKAERVCKLQEVLRQWIPPLKLPSTVRLKIDIEPYGFL